MPAQVGVESPWGPLAVSDAHVHFFSHRFFKLLAAQKQGLRVEDLPSLLGWKLPPAEAAAFAEQWVQELDRHGVHRAVLIASLPGDAGSVAEAAAKHPERFWAFSMFDPIHQVAESVLTRGIRGLCFFPALHRYSMHDPQCLEAVAACAGKAAVFVHCGALSIGVRKKLGLPMVYDPRYSNPLDVEWIAHAHPEVNFVIPHFGSGMFREALLVASHCPNVYLDTSSSNSWMQVEGMDLRAVLARALGVLGPRRLLFGTDSSFFPRGWNRAVYEAQATAWYELGISKTDAEMIFHENLVRLLHFS